MFNFSNKRKILKLQNSNLNIKSYWLILGSYFFHLKPYLGQLQKPTFQCPNVLSLSQNRANLIKEIHYKARYIGHPLRESWFCEKVMLGCVEVRIE